MDVNNHLQLATFELTDPDLYYKIEARFGAKGGVYLIRARNGKGDDWQSIARVLLPDSTGVLYIGKATSYLNRVIELKKSVLPNYKTMSHEFGSRLVANAALSGAFRIESLRISLIGSEDPSGLEANLLEEYETKFGELPPFNRVGGKSV